MFLVYKKKKDLNDEINENGASAPFLIPTSLKIAP